MSAEKRRYLTHIKEVTLMASIPSPTDNTSREGYGHELHRFFIEAGFFCIESRRTGKVEDVPPSMIKRRRWLTPEEQTAAAEKAAAELSSP